MQSHYDILGDDLFGDIDVAVNKQFHVITYYYTTRTLPSCGRQERSNENFVINNYNDYCRHHRQHLLLLLLLLLLPLLVVWEEWVVVVVVAFLDRINFHTH